MQRHYWYDVMHTVSLQKERRTALMFAAKNGVFSIVQLLLKFKPDVNIKDSVSVVILFNLLKLYSTHMTLFTTVILQSNKTALDLAPTPEIRHCLKVAPVRLHKSSLNIYGDY
jgi:hypothetical protein